jgi:two-component system, cell cycle sensor histidine kinase and response regulator CckA
VRTCSAWAATRCSARTIAISSPPSRPFTPQALDRETLEKGAVVDIAEEPIQTPRGERWLHTKKIPIKDEAGRPTHLLGISEDITEMRAAQLALKAARAELEERVAARSAELMTTNEALRKSEEQLLHAQKMEAVGRLAGGVAHDFNNMLSVILSYASLILDDLPEKDPMREDVGEIAQAASRATSLTQQLLAFSRRQVMNLGPVDLNAIVGGMEKMLQRLIGEDIELKTILCATLGRARADAGQIEQVLLNLAVNARDAMPAGGKLTLETANVVLDEAYASEHLGARAGRHVMLAVSDSGVGMSAEVRQRIFEPFYTTKELGKGTGLGLSTVFGIVKQSGGNIWVYSEPGRGTTFKVYLPEVEGDAAAEPSRSIAPRAAEGKETILLVEDEELVRRAARASLRRMGYTILEASSASEALMLCERYSGPIHLMVTDVVMPAMSGRELAERLARIRPEIKVLYMSGYTDNTIVHHGVLDPGVEFLQKPFTPEVLGRRIREVLDR